MKDMQAHLATLREQIAKCQALEQASKTHIKRDIFRRLVAHYKVLAGELERAIDESRKRPTRSSPPQNG